MTNYNESLDALAQKGRRTERLKQKRFKRKQKEKQKEKDLRIRLIPIWLRLLIIAGLMLIGVIIGVFVGYSVIGDGQAKDALKKSTWQHVIDLVNKDVNQ